MPHAWRALARDWYRLIEICGLTDTLVIDEDGVYDPTQYNDRLLLGIKGTMSEAEPHWIRSRLLGGKLERARSRQLRFRPPTGLVYDPAGQILFDPDEQVQHALRLLFDTFEQVVPRWGWSSIPPRIASVSPPGSTGEAATVNSSGAPWTTAASWPSCIIRRTRAPTSTDGPRPATPSCPVKRHGSKGGRAASPWRTGRRSCTTTISRLHHLGAVPAQPATTYRELHITAPGASRGTPRRCGVLQGLVLCGRCWRRMIIRYMNN